VKANLFVAAALVAVAAAPNAQENPPAQNPPPVAAAATPASVAAPAPAPGQAPAPPASSRRRDISRMERVLTQALQEGAQDLAAQLKVRDPNSAFVTGTGRARGFILDGYGMFFDVDVPGMRQSVIWSAQMLELERERRANLGFLDSSSPNDPRRRLAEANLRQIARLMGTPPGAILVPNETTNAQMAPPPGRIDAAVAVAEGTTVPPTASSLATAATQTPAPQMQQVQQRDPNELYTEAVKHALIDAMLDFSAFLKIADHEWLTVAASDSDGPQIPGQIDDASRILIRIKGADLAAFQAKKLTRAEVLKKVEVKEF
jgi:hypothetical protein